MLKNGEEKRTAKEINKCVTQKDLRHAMYLDCLQNETITLNKMKRIKSDKLVLHMNRVVKRGLCSYDDKRYVLDDKISTYSYGHYKIKN